MARLGSLAFMQNPLSDLPTPNACRTQRGDITNGTKARTASHCIDDGSRSCKRQSQVSPSAIFEELGHVNVTTADYVMHTVATVQGWLTIQQERASIASHKSNSVPCWLHDAARGRPPSGVLHCAGIRQRTAAAGVGCDKSEQNRGSSARSGLCCFACATASRGEDGPCCCQTRREDGYWSGE